MYPYNYSIIDKNGEKTIIETDAPVSLFSRVCELAVGCNVPFSSNIIEVLRSLGHKAEVFSPDKEFDFQKDLEFKKLMNKKYDFNKATSLLEKGYVLSNPEVPYDYIRLGHELLLGMYSNSKDTYELKPSEVKKLISSNDWYVVDIKTFLK
jgi:hypothetical protein